eukprot:CAMPEP_0194488662 /NCGR_PEP_ID=MMETSP0253-20130528/8504_1 /TAXON_ID=2966 /ORGANISM="Noctiluca scintillans" /LENGTH=60 /DNA_ID=CAMNT_0039329053 /DNA_START=113 /DNA_END=295 /DNA_ORIENTATION=-
MTLKVVQVQKKATIIKIQPTNRTAQEKLDSEASWEELPRRPNSDSRLRAWTEGASVAIMK